MRTFYAFHAWWFISRSRGPLQKVCHGPARMSGHNCLQGPQSLRRQSVSPEGDHMNKTRGSTGGWQCRWNPHNQNRPHAFPHASTTTPISRLCNAPTVGETLGPGGCSPTGGEDSHSLSVPTDLGDDHPVTHGSCLVRHEAHGRDAISLVQTHPQTPSPVT